MTERAIGVHESAVDAVRQAVAVIDATEFAAYGGGWPGEIGTALVDAVFSIRATYQSQNPKAGVLHRVQMLKSTHPRRPMIYGP